MRKTSNVLTGLIAAGICGAMVWLTLGAGLATIIYNLSFLAVMLVIILLALIFGFRRMRQTVRGLDNASRKLISVYKNKADMADITRPGAQIFGVEYLDRKYQEYLGYLRKTNSPCDIGDYIGEYEINNYTHRRLVELVPDVLTSLGILGTFIGLVWGLKGFNPVSYEAMASSITSLIDGIKVAFVTSIFGISLSLAYTYWMRGALTGVSESLDNFTDKYYLCAVSPTDATAMNHVLSNQKEQIRVLTDVTGNLSDAIAVSMADHLDPVLSQMNQTLDHFTDTVTLNQQDLMETIAATVMGAMKKEFFSEFIEMRNILRETNNAQKSYLENLASAQEQFEKNLAAGTRQMTKAMDESSARQKESMSELKVQQEHLTEFVDYMSRAMAQMTAVNEENAKVVSEMGKQIEAMEKLTEESVHSAAKANEAMAAAQQAARDAEAPPVHNTIDDLDELTERLDKVIDLMEKTQRKQQGTRRGIFR